MTKHPDWSAYGRLGAEARKRALSPEERQAIARTAALARHKRSTKQQRSAAARRAVMARWAQEKAEDERPIAFSKKIMSRPPSGESGKR